jgi:hypothetical protein
MATPGARDLTVLESLVIVANEQTKRVEAERDTLRARVRELEAALRQAQTLWFNALFDQGTPRELHVTWFNEWVAAHMNTPDAGGA